MNVLYVIGGIVCLAVGIYITVGQVKKIKEGRQDQLGFDYKLLAGGVMAIIGGITIIAKYIV